MFALRITALVFAVVVFMAASAAAQSTDVAFPTPITANELDGTIKPRDIGDNRQTTYYYTFGGNQGDIFVNVVTANFEGEIEIFAQDGMRSLARILVYSDSPQTETGRLIYLRKPEQLLLRIRGNAASEKPATYRFKFAGSFVALEKTADAEPAPVVETPVEGVVRVNSVGTIIGAPRSPETQTKSQSSSSDKSLRAEESNRGSGGNRTEIADKRSADRPAGKAEDVADANSSKSGSKNANAEKSTANAKPPRRPLRVVKTDRTQQPKKDSAASDAGREKTGEQSGAAAARQKTDPLANVKLVIDFKDGTRSSVPLPELLRFTVDRGTLVVLRKNGTIERYRMIDVARVTIE
jgi:hypothetical protein